MMKPTPSLFCVLRTDTVLFMLLRVAIAARAIFESVRPLILTEHARSYKNSVMRGGSNIEGESQACLLHFEALAKQEKMLLPRVVKSYLLTHLLT